MIRNAVQIKSELCPKSPGIRTSAFAECLSHSVSYIEKLRIFGKVFLPLFPPFAHVQILWLRLPALRLCALALCVSFPSAFAKCLSHRGNDLHLLFSLEVAGV